MAPKSPKMTISWVPNNFRAELSAISSYDEDLKIMLVLLRKSFLSEPLTKTTTSIPQSYIHHASSTVVYDPKENVVKFKLIDNSDVILDRNFFVHAIGLRDMIPPTADE